MLNFIELAATNVKNMVNTAEFQFFYCTLLLGYNSACSPK